VLDHTPQLPAQLRMPAIFDTGDAAASATARAGERHRAVERGISGLYRWYVARSRSQLGLPALRALETDIQRSRALPAHDREAELGRCLDRPRAERAAAAVFDPARRYAETAGVAHTMCVDSVPVRVSEVDRA
jgi:hypothetical protein